MTIMNNATMNIGIQVFCGHIFSSLGYSNLCFQIAGLLGNSMFNFLRKLPFWNLRTLKVAMLLAIFSVTTFPEGLALSV